MSIHVDEASKRVRKCYHHKIQEKKLWGAPRRCPRSLSLKSTKYLERNHMDRSVVERKQSDENEPFNTTVVFFYIQLTFSTGRQKIPCGMYPKPLAPTWNFHKVVFCSRSFIAPCTTRGKDFFFLNETNVFIYHRLFLELVR